VKRAPLAIAAAGALLITACASDGDDSLDSGRPPASDAVGTTSPTTTDATADTADTTTPATVPAPPAADPTTTDTTGPLTEPNVALFEIGSFDQPVDVAFRPAGGDIHVIEQPGRVVAVNDLSAEVVLDITDLTERNSEQGLLGLAFHPTADLAYVNFTDADGDTVVAEFAIDPTTAMFERDSYREVLTIEQPYSNHNGGHLVFGPDQLLYIGVGDGGSSNDPERNALDLSSRLGKILRIDPVAAGDQPFTVPADNPFVDTADADPTIWASGLRNPWRFSFDSPTGDLWIGDVGQLEFEEINRSPATDRRDAARGANFGWSAFEGFERFNEDQPADDAVAPLHVYSHDEGRCSVTGGTVARGDVIADLAGWYLFGDYCTGEIWGLDTTSPPADPRIVDIAELAAVVAITEAPDGEVYAVSNAGTIARLMPG
jgi:glucose/arabinose dehydrogenase